MGKVVQYPSIWQQAVAQGERRSAVMTTDLSHIPTERLREALQWTPQGVYTPDVERQMLEAAVRNRPELIEQLRVEERQS
jgi:hypothetical protein